MMPQTVLPFKLEPTDEQLTAHDGLVLFGEFLQAMNVPRQLNAALPEPGSRIGYHPPPICRAPAADGAWWGPDAEGSAPDSRGRGLAGGATSPRGPQCRCDGRLAATQGEQDGLASLAVVNQQQIRRALKREPRTDYTLDLDATQIVAEKQEATWTYKGERGYLPMLGHLAENGLVIGEEFREGHEAPASRNLEFTQPCAAQMPKGKRIAHVRADSAAYQAELFNWCEEHKVTFAIGGVQDTAVQAAIPIDEFLHDMRSALAVEVERTPANGDRNPGHLRFVVRSNANMRSIVEVDADRAVEPVRDQQSLFPAPQADHARPARCDEFVRNDH